MRERAVADLATAGTADAAGFADRERREVVVQHEAAFEFTRLQIVDVLHVLRGAERGRDDAPAFRRG